MFHRILQLGLSTQSIVKHIKLFQQFLNEGVEFATDENGNDIEIKSTKEIKVGDELYYSANVSGLAPIKVKVTKIVNDGYFIGEIIEIDEKTADYKGWEKGQSFQLSVGYIKVVKK